MKRKILILSDIFGIKDQKYLDDFKLLFSENFEVEILDSLKLSGLEKNNFSKEEVHQKMVDGGIDVAVNELKKYKSDSLFAVIGFSIGGTIAWKACLQGLKIENLILISSTRIRKEVEKPDANILSVFGELDKFSPQKEWFKKMNLHPMIVENVGHEFYKETEILKFVYKTAITWM